MSRNPNDTIMYPDFTKMPCHITDDGYALSQEIKAEQKAVRVEMINKQLQEDFRKRPEEFIENLADEEVRDLLFEIMKISYSKYGQLSTHFDRISEAKGINSVLDREIVRTAEKLAGERADEQ